ncbi:hypothetical protein BHE74_00051137 [Ensete ventricosum]|nr:hypothetical protein BHE74_00051137 [Ensete ventricosum]
MAEESARPGSCRVRKLVHVSQWRGHPVGFGSASLESAPRVGFLGNRSSRCLPRRTCTKASLGWGGMARNAALMVPGGTSTVVTSGRYHLRCRRDYGAGASSHLTQMSTWLLS